MSQLVKNGELQSEWKTPRGADMLRYARRLRGFTQAESAAFYGIEERTLRRWENNEFNPKWNDVVGLIEDVYLLNVVELIEELAHESRYHN